MIEYQDAKKLAGMLAAVGEQTRMLILHRLAEGPAHVGKLAELVGVPMVNMSHHLGVMRQAGLLEDSKDGRRVVYTLREDVFTPGGPHGGGVLQLGPMKMTLAPAENGDAGKKKGAANAKAKGAKAKSV